MMARVIDGKTHAARERAELAQKVATFRRVVGYAPRLDVVLVGDHPASAVYVRNKEKAREQAGMEGRVHRLPAETAQHELAALVADLNHDPNVHGILVQLPLPAHLDAQAIIEAIDPRKDVDGFHPENVGLLALGRPRFVPCTPLGVMRLLKAEGIATTGREAVVLGRSAIVGLPMSLLLAARGTGDATTTICHTATSDPRAVARRADLLIVAMGRAETVDADWIKPGAVVIDVGIHKRDDGRLVGDVVFESAARVATAITPVPGGVGPMTIAMLLNNTYEAARAALARSGGVGLLASLSEEGCVST